MWRISDGLAKSDPSRVSLDRLAFRENHLLVRNSCFDEEMETPTLLARPWNYDPQQMRRGVNVFAALGVVSGMRGHLI